MYHLNDDEYVNEPYYRKTQSANYASDERCKT